MKKIVLTTLALLQMSVLVLLIGCENIEQDEKLALPTETEIKRTLLQKIPAVTGTYTQLSADSVISFAMGEYPVDLTLNENNVFVAENNKGKIYQINMDSQEVQELPISQETGKKLLYPTSIRLADGRLWLFDNDGLKTFDKEGKNLSLTKVFSSVTHFDINPDRILYANSLINKSQENNHLITKINERGEITGGIGKRNNKEIEERAFISLTDKFVVLGFKNRPIIQIYDKSTESLVKEINVAHRIFPELENSITKLQEDYKKEGKTFLPRYITGLKVSQDKIFVLLFLPYIEIVELDLHGNELRRYQAQDSTENLDYFGFDVRLVGKHHQFIIGTMSGPRNPTLKVFSNSNVNQKGGN